MKQLLLRSIRGFVLGMALGNLIAVLMSTFTGDGSIVAHELVERMGSETAALFIQTILSGVYGAIAMGGTSLYEIENKWFGLTASAVSHYLLTILSYIPIALFLSWLVTWEDILFMAVLMTIAYLIVFLIMYIRYKAEVRELNRISSQLAVLKSGDTQGR